MGGLRDPKVGQLDRKSVLFANPGMDLLPNPQTLKTELRACNEHSVRCFTNFQTQFYLWRGGGSVEPKRESI